MPCDSQRASMRRRFRLAVIVAGIEAQARQIFKYLKIDVVVPSYKLYFIKHHLSLSYKLYFIEHLTSRCRSCCY